MLRDAKYPGNCGRKSTFELAARLTASNKTAAAMLTISDMRTRFLSVKLPLHAPSELVIPPILPNSKHPTTKIPDELNLPQVRSPEAARRPIRDLAHPK